MYERHPVPHHAHLHVLVPNGLVHVHVAVPGQGLGGGARVALARHVAVALAAAAVVLILDPEHGVGAVDGQGEGEQDGQVPLVVVDGGGLIHHAGHGTVNDKTGSLGVLCSLLVLELLDNLEELFVIIVVSFEAGGPAQRSINTELFDISRSSVVALCEVYPIMNKFF